MPTVRRTKGEHFRTTYRATHSSTRRPKRFHSDFAGKAPRVKVAEFPLCLSCGIIVGRGPRLHGGYFVPFCDLPTKKTTVIHGHGRINVFFGRRVQTDRRVLDFSIPFRPSTGNRVYVDTTPDGRKKLTPFVPRKSPAVLRADCEYHRLVVVRVRIITQIDK